MLRNKLVLRLAAVATAAAAALGVGLTVQSHTQAAEATTITCHLQYDRYGNLYWSCTNPGCRVGSPC